MSDWAARPGEVDVPTRAPTLRRASAGLGVVAIALALGGMLAASQMDGAFIDSYQVDGNTLWVGYAPDAGCESMIRVRASETDDAVVLDIVGWKRIPFVASNAMQEICTARFDLKEPLGERELRLANGRSVAEEWARVGR